MGRIKVLDESTASKIAAGEVIERPASAVKELVENSLDAGATRIEVEVEHGGKSLIRVTDNGCGMDREDAVLAFCRHATSKIGAPDDLLDVSTYGFRGEALASIAAVADVEMRTSIAGAAAGTLVVARAGLAPEAADCPSTPGTSISVRDLFSHFPARLKFMKSDAAEAARITDVMYSMALGNPGVSFSLSVDGRRTMATQGTGALIDTIASLFGAEFARLVTPVTADAQGSVSESAVSVTGYAGKPQAARASRGWQYIFVNGRHVRSLAIRSAAEEAYRGLIQGKRFPALFLNVELPRKTLDVNIHPQKAEVKMLRERDVARSVYVAVRDSLSGPVDSTHGEATHGREIDRSSPGQQATGLGGRGPAGFMPSGAGRQFAQARESLPAYGGTTGLLELFAPPSGPISPAQAGRMMNIRGLTVIGQLLDSYILAECAGGLCIVDQHAAHERIRYERLLDEANSPQVQSLISPLLTPMSPSDFEKCLDCLDVLGMLGFDVEPFGDNTLVIRGVPAGLEQDFSCEMLAGVVRAAGSAPRGSTPVEAAAAALAACHSAVRAGQRLSPAEMTALLTDLAGTRNPLTCPHGRPTVLEIGVEEIERRLGRR